MPMVAGRCVWEVRAGIIPGTADQQHTRRWGLTSDEWHSEKGLELFVERAALANAYASYLQLLCSQGREVNWTVIDFVWF